MIGDRLGKWRIFRELGRGGMGCVYLAQEELTGRRAALKVLAAELAADAGFRERFQREIAALAKLDHPGIVRFYESGFENGLHFYAMEYVEGQSLDEVRTEQGRLPWAEVLDIALQICPALKHVHDHGIIHRDLKPPNLLRDHEGRIKLTDFGIARIFAAPQLTKTGGVVGTADYLSPEQAAGKPASKRSDLYSLGVVLYALVTGRTPFTGVSMVDLLHKHQYAQFDRPARVVPELPYEIDEIICQLLEKDPAKRPADCLVLGKQLDAVRRKLIRKSEGTQAGLYPGTVAEQGNFHDGNEPGSPGPGTLMGQMMRAELQRQSQGGPIARFLGRPWVLLLLLTLCGGVLVWTFWPHSADDLFARGAELMEKDHLVYWERAWREYLGPLESRFPDHPHKEAVDAFRRKLEAGRAPAASEAQRLFQQGDRLRHDGQFAAAKRTWQGVVLVFAESSAEQHWVRQTEKALVELEREASAPERWRTVRPALDRAALLHKAGRVDEAERLWSALEELYREDPWAGPLLAEIAVARKNGPMP